MISLPTSRAVGSDVDGHETISIRQTAQDCAACFGQLLHFEDYGTSKVPLDPFWASRQCANFNLWWNKVGISQTGLRSIDVRLRDVPDIPTMLLRLLQTLHHDLKRLISHLEGSPAFAKEQAEATPHPASQRILKSLETLSSSEASEESGVEPATARKFQPSDKIRQHIGQTIDRLQGYARRIEQAGAEHRQRRLDLYRQKNRIQQTYEAYRRIGEVKAQEHFRKAPAYIHSRMADSFARRRTRFDYIKEHHRKRRANTHIVPEPRLNVKHLNKQGDLEAHRVQITTESPARNSQTVSRFHDQETVLSKTIDTEYRMRPGLVEIQHAESVRSVTLKHPGFSQPPLAQDGARKASVEDFEPYFCTYESCESPFNVPNSFEGLLDHLQTHNPVGYHVDEPNGEHKMLLEADYDDHVQSLGLTNEAQNILKSSSQRRGVYVFNACPFCGGYPDVVEKGFPDPSKLEAQNELRRHIKQHMQEISLFLPPYRSDILDNDDDLGGSATTHRRSNCDDVSGNPREYAQSCSREDCDCKSVSPDAAKEKIIYVPDLSIVLKPEARWMCCLCLNNYPWIGREESDLCTYCRNHSKYSHSPYDCQLCFKYERILDDESDWITYDRSDPSVEELRADSQLEPFVRRNELNKDFIEVQRHPTPAQEWSVEFQRWLSSPHWDSSHQAYFRAHYDASQRQWVFFDWLPRSANNVLRSRSDSMENFSRTRIPTNFADSSHQTSLKGATIVGTYTADNPQAHESLDPAFLVRHSSFFVEGRVIAILFTNPAGNTTKVYNSAISLVAYHDGFRTQIRRFVVVGLKHGFCFACPIFTYGNQGTKKNGVRPQEHAIAYSEGCAPTPLIGEEKLTKEPICIVMNQKERPLVKESRICFGVHHPIQHNVKVKHIGDVKTSHVPTLLGYWKMQNVEFGGNPAEVEAEAEASDRKKDPYAFHPKKNLHGFDAEQNPDGFHPDHNPFGYHPKLNPYGFDRAEMPHAYHPTYNQFGFHKPQNIIGYHPKKSPYGYHPEQNPHGFHPQLNPFCYHPELNVEGYHSRDNPRGYHPKVNRYGYHFTDNPHGFHPEANPYGYHGQINPHGYHPIHSPRGYHPQHNPSTYHPDYNKVKPLVHLPGPVSRDTYEALLAVGEEEEDDDSDENDVLTMA